MFTVKQLLKSKHGDVWTVAPEDTAYKALEMLADKDVGALMVVKDDKVVGIFSERDYARKVILKGKSSKNTPVSEIMTAKVCYVHLSNTMEECMALMTDKRARHLPVIEGGRLIGIVSIGDVVKQIVDEKEFTIKQLENYISGGL
ncbi:MAG: CBS domain protein [Candidatus Scalindua rubra]|uniref:CBS domain protein n=1 Tax=Candidatus Scalindua rubra TaxID=1872076 RepID=A0A1E3X8Q4_9BACT|nr:MAG: CBS domain protein [Candidatus Scalindua rubra]